MRWAPSSTGPAAHRRPTGSTWRANTPSAGTTSSTSATPSGSRGPWNRDLLAPVLAAFAHALPRTYAGVDAAPGTTVTLTIPETAGGRWSVRREAKGWMLYSGAPAAPDAAVTLPADAAWRRFTNGLTPAQARARATLSGDEALAARLLETIAIIA